MIWGEWKDPNFKFWATDADGNKYEFLCLAESSDEICQRLKEKRMTPIRIEPYPFQKWIDRANEAKDKAIRAYKLYGLADFRQELWAELKWHLFDLFHGKCAYCESRPLVVTTGDVEHYRPKAKVTGQKHPGYYWLAYEVSNLLPSCELCNRPPGKTNHFPIKRRYARKPEDDLAKEEPYLLNPYDHNIDPFEHLEFNDIGDVIPHKGSHFGENSMRYYRLNRPGIGEARRKAMSEVRQDWQTLVIRLVGLGKGFWYDTITKEVTLGHREYSAAQRWELARIAKAEGVSEGSVTKD